MQGNEQGAYYSLFTIHCSLGIWPSNTNDNSVNS